MSAPADYGTPELTISHPRQARLMRLATILAMIVAAALVLIKFATWQISGSLSMLSSLIDSVLDVGMSAMNFFAVRAALIPADRDHRFGHGKAEALAALAQSLFIVISSFWLLLESAQRVMIPHPIQHETWSMAAMAVSIVMTQGLVMFQNYVVMKTGSVAIAADRLHYKTDTAINFSVLLAIGLIWQTGLLWIDAVLAAVVAMYLVWCGRSILGMAMDVLLDRELPEPLREKIVAIIESDPDIAGFHDLRTRMAGPNYFIQFHLEMNPELTLAQAHHIADRIENAISQVMPNAQISIHQEPAGINDPRDNF